VKFRVAIQFVKDPSAVRYRRVDKYSIAATERQLRISAAWLVEERRGWCHSFFFPSDNAARPDVDIHRRLTPSVIRGEVLMERAGCRSMPLFLGTFLMTRGKVEAGQVVVKVYYP